jgi:hypothetical protein
VIYKDNEDFVRWTMYSAATEDETKKKPKKKSAKPADPLVATDGKIEKGGSDDEGQGSGRKKSVTEATGRKATPPLSQRVGDECSHLGGPERVRSGLKPAAVEATAGEHLGG